MGRGHLGAAGGVFGLAEFIDKFGEELEYDLHHYLGLDLLDWIAGLQPWGKLHRLAARLPLGSQYRSALLLDPDFADAAVELNDPDDEDAPISPHGYTLNTHILLSIIDTLREVQQTIILLSGNDPPTFPRAPRPTTAIDDARARQHEEQMLGLIALFEPPDA